uniref:Uncharacterized protein n=1 Tax=Anguilla anguilla TaxID=7936 RepID=A0A0E9UQW1_ANGAN
MYTLNVIIYAIITVIRKEIQMLNLMGRDG